MKYVAFLSQYERAALPANTQVPQVQSSLLRPVPGRFSYESAIHTITASNSSATSSELSRNADKAAHMRETAHRSESGRPIPGCFETIAVTANLASSATSSSTWSAIASKPQVSAKRRQAAGYAKWG